jgi:hypothetical protein
MLDMFNTTMFRSSEHQKFDDWNDVLCDQPACDRYDRLANPDNYRGRYKSPPMSYRFDRTGMRAVEVCGNCMQGKGEMNAYLLVETPQYIADTLARFKRVAALQAERGLKSYFPV